MYPYFIQLLILLFFFYRSENSSYLNFYRNYKKEFLIFNLIFLSIFIGFREGVGGDWYNYQNIYYESKNLDFFLNVFKRYGLYSFFGLTFGNLNIPINYVNFIYSALFVFGIYSFIKNDKNPYFSLIIFFPVLIIVVGMGFTRQSAAIGIYLYLISKNKFEPFRDVLIILSSIFLIHISAVFCFLPFVCKYILNKKYFKFIYLVIFLFSLFLIFFKEQIFFYLYNYIFKDVIFSFGLIPRVILCLIPSIFFILNIRYFKKKENFFMWLMNAILAILFFLLIILKSTNPAIDRFSFFLIPFQAYVYKELAENITEKNISIFFKIIVILGYFFIFVFWLKYAIHSKYWLPYMINFFVY